MEFPNRVRGAVKKCPASTYCERLPRARKGALLLVPFLAFAFAHPLSAQDTSPLGSVSGGQTSNPSDCADPLMAASPECSGQNGPGSTSFPTALPSSLQSLGYGPEAGNQGTYSDLGNLTQQGVVANQMQQMQLPPEPLTEFQKFVASTTGQVLPIFGSDLFRYVPSTFAPLNMTPVPLDYVLGPGDELRIHVWGQVNFQANLQVDRSGEIFLPQIGPVHVEGLHFSELDSQLRDAIGRVYHSFNLTADVGQTRAIQVYVTGFARRPGVYTISSLSTLVDALFASGGPAVQGSMRHLELLRDNKMVTDFDLYRLLSHGDKSKDAKLLPGDVIFIPPVGPQVALTGSVRNPGIYEVRSNESLADLLDDAGGVSSVAAESRISMERIENHRYRSAMEVAFDKTGLATTLTGGDIIRIFSIIPMYRKTVILRGNTANPGRFVWQPGMRISDLIPDKESLITRNYWWRRAQLGLPAPEFTPMPYLAHMHQPKQNQPITVRPTEINPNSLSQLPSQTNQSTNSQDQREASQVGPESMQQGQLQSPQDQPGYGQGQSGSQQDQRLGTQQGGGNTSLAGTQTFSSTQAFPSIPKTTIQQLAPEIDWNYAAIERLDPKTLKAVVIPFDLGRLVLQHDSSQDLKLLAGDVVTIFSDADIKTPLAQQTKFVTLEGEFAHAGVYTVEPGETLRHLVERAGGLTPNAYLYGSEFTRESTREVQQSRIDEYVQNLSLRIQRSALTAASAGATSAQDLSSGAAAEKSENGMLAMLRQVRATGRIVLQFSPTAMGADSIPQVALENGDDFVVPSVPATVNVIGAVYDQNSFLYEPERDASMYLKRAGGPTRDADSRHEFIIRADGAVVSRDTTRGLWGNGFDSLRIYPGDTIVVPEKVYRPSTLRGILDWSQMFSQFALGAAAISVIQ